MFKPLSSSNNLPLWWHTAHGCACMQGRPKRQRRFDGIAVLSTPQCTAQLCAFDCRIQAQGAPAVIAGGAVRDILLGTMPADFDVAAGLGSQAITNLFPEKARGVLPNRLGTVQVEFKGAKVEVTPLRGYGRVRMAAKEPFDFVNVGRCARSSSAADTCAPVDAASRHDVNVS